jgi:hypothetical protein
MNNLKEFLFFIAVFPLMLLGLVLSVGGDYANRAGTWILNKLA